MQVRYFNGGPADAAPQTGRAETCTRGARGLQTAAQR
jgi:hypothetical protein